MTLKKMENIMLEKRMINFAFLKSLEKITFFDRRKNNK